MAAETPWRKKLIEVAIPLEAINEASVAEKRPFVRKHPRAVHRWLAPRPLSASRAVLFCSLIDDPAEPDVPVELLDRIDALSEPSPLPSEWDRMDLAEQRRQKLFKFIETMVQWKNRNDDSTISTARDLILAATGGNPPPVLDPFCGGGSIPLEAQRLGLEAHGSDLNPVAVLITKALIELPPKFAGMPPVNPDARAKLGKEALWQGASGLAEDIRWYGEWVRNQAWERVGHLYPEGPNGETIIAWIWARTVTCPNPACRSAMPLVSSFWLSKKKGREAWLVPVTNQADKSTHFEVRHGPPPDAKRVAAGFKVAQATFQCSICSTVVKGDYIDRIANDAGLGIVPIAIVTDPGRRQGRRYYDAIGQHADLFKYDVAGNREHPHLLDSIPTEPCRGTFGSNAQGRRYGFETFGDYFTDRQQVSLGTFSAVISDARQMIKDHANQALPSAAKSQADAYADAVSTYLALALSRLTDFCNALATWRPTNSDLRNLFSQQGIGMAWDFAELNPFADLLGLHTLTAKTGEILSEFRADRAGIVSQQDVTRLGSPPVPVMVCTDPPYYDNIVYTDIADFFYVWLRRTLRDAYPGELATVLTPKAQELVVADYRFAGDKEAARQHFEDGLAAAFGIISRCSTAEVPTTVFYADKQDERESAKDPAISTGWEKMLSALVASGFRITGTWPMRTEGSNRTVALGSNALATSVVLVCRPRSDDASMANVGEFNRALASELPVALRRFIGEHIAPVDLPQASIGPGMAVFSRYSAVVRPNGDHMTVREALELINAGVEQFFSEREGAFDGATQFCLRWFEQFGFEDGPFGDADTMARAKDISVEELQRDGLLTARRGQVQLLPFERYEATWESWEPSAERRLSAWRACHYLAAALEHGGVFGGQGDHDAGGAALLARELGGNGEQAKELAYRLYAICDAKGWASEARRYNALADAWSEISAEAGRLRQAQQGRLG